MKKGFCSFHSQPPRHCSLAQEVVRSIRPEHTTIMAWEAVPDPEGSGESYYWNAETGEVTWEMPPELAAASSQADLNPFGDAPPASIFEDEAPAPPAALEPSSSSAAAAAARGLVAG